jgi:hypothetical protein
LLLVLAIAGPAAVFLLGKNYWLLIPFGIVSNLPAIPLGGRAIAFSEAWILASALFFLVRFPFGDHSLKIVGREYFLLYAYAGLAFVIFLAGGTGLAILGASSFGARSYITIGLAVFAILIIANQPISENQCKWLVRTLLVGGCVATVVGISRVLLGIESYAQGEGALFYTWHQHLRYAPMVIALFLIARYPLTEVMSRPRVFVLLALALCMVAVLLSGKREAVVSIIIFAVGSMVARRSWAILVSGSAIVAVLLSVVVLGHGKLLELPPVAQRALSFLPGDWDAEVKYMASDPFRETLNRLAFEKIRRSPWIGEGYAMSSDAFSLDYRRYGFTADQSYAAYFMAEGHQWHNIWTATAVDFGIPATIIWALLWLQILVQSYRVCNRTRVGSYRHVVAMMILLITVTDIITSWVGGHSANTLMSLSWQFGIILALGYQLQAEERSNESNASIPSPQPIGGVDDK